VIRAGDLIFIDTGAFVATSVAGDPHHEEAASLWMELLDGGAKPVASVPVVLETFTYLQRRLGEPVAQAWRAALSTIPRLRILDCTAADLGAAWAWFERRDLHKLGLVDATSFVLMKKQGIRRAFTFDIHFSAAGFKILRSSPK
jgi:predicted nucleic acid-binding protein